MFRLAIAKKNNNNKKFSEKSTDTICTRRSIDKKWNQRERRGKGKRGDSGGARRNAWHGRETRKAIWVTSHDFRRSRDRRAMHCLEWASEREREREWERETGGERERVSDKASIFASVKAACARCSGALREEGRATMHADPYSGRCYFRSILSIEEGRRTTWRARRGYVTLACF